MNNVWSFDGCTAKGFRAGTHRTRPPAETIQLYARFMPRMGITRLANVTGLDFIGLPVYVAVRPNARSLTVSQGKGIDADSAKASALMEGIEFWHAERIDKPLRRESHDALLRSAPVLDLCPVEQQLGRTVPRDLPLDWIEGYDLMKGHPVWVPFDLVSLDFVSERSIASRNGNGLASGNHLAEAVAHALCELIERDATTLWFELDEDGTSGKSSQVRADSVRDPGCRMLLERISAAGLLTGIYDNTSDLGVPSYQCVVLDRPGGFRAMGYFWGFGCHLSPEVALMRALSEAVQCRLTEITGTRDDILAEDYEENRSDDELREMQQLIEDPPPARDFGERVSLATESFEGDIAVLLGAFRSAGIESAVAVDLTRPEIGIPVVKVIVPELEGIPFKHAPGPRLTARRKGGESA